MPGSLQPYLTLPFLYLAASMAGALFALNAYRPLIRRGPLSLSAFFAGWLTSELPFHHILWQLLATLALIWWGALLGWPGWLGLAITLASWASLIYLVIQARRAEVVMESALTEVIGSDYASRIAPAAAALTPLDSRPALLSLLRPFAMRHRDVERIRNISYGEYGRRNMLDIYRRKEAGSLRPVLIQVHGGAWVVGSKVHQGLPLMNLLAAQGWVCVAINYRLSPRATFPDHIVDVKRAIAWVKANIEKWGGDPDFVVIAGGSAGGHLAALAALTAGDADLQPGFEEADTSVRACVPFYGIYDFTNKKGVGRADMRQLLERLVMKRKLASDRPAFERASPLYRITADAPPFFVIHGENDVLVPVAEARLFVEELRASSRAPVAYAELPGAQHAFEVFVSLRTAHVIRGVARFLAYIHSEHMRSRAAGERPDARAA